MMHLMRRVFIMLIVLLLIPAPTLAFKCPDGSESHAATADEAASAGKSKDGSTSAIIAGTTQVCPNDAKAGISGDAGAAKEYLKSILCPNSNYGGAGPDGTIKGLNPSFAQCSAQFLKTEKQKMPDLCLREGYRTVDTQEKYAQEYRNGGGIACTKGANCEHPKGIAIDVNVADGQYPQLWDDAHSYGLVFYLRNRDKVHFVPIAHRQGQSSGPCLTSNYDPSSGQYSSRDGMGGGPSDYGGNTPSSPFSQALRDYLSGGNTGGGMGGGMGGGGQVPTGIQGFGGGASPYGAMQPANNSMPSSNQQPYGSAQPATGATPAAGSQIGTIAQGGTTATPGQTAVPASTAQTDQTQTAVSSMLNENIAQPGANAFDAIGAIAFPTTTASTTLIAYTGAVPSTIALNQNTIGQVTAQPQSGTAPVGTDAQGSHVTLTPDANAGGGQSTFATEQSGSFEKSWTFESQSVLADTLERIRQILLKVIDLLRPFRYVQGGSGSEQHYE